MILSFSIFTFDEGNEEKIKLGLDEHLQLMKNQSGLIRSFVAQALDKPHKYLLYCEWDSREHYEAMGEKLRDAKEVQNDFEEFFSLMAEEPVFGSFEINE
jgi:heme-degrading monooxygenase HmoA